MILYPLIIPPRKPRGTSDQCTINSVIPSAVVVVLAGGRSGAKKNCILVKKKKKTTAQMQMKNKQAHLIFVESLSITQTFHNDIE